jgi:hypothetical protein
MRRCTKLVLSLGSLAALVMAGTASANVSGFDPQVQPGSSTTVAQAIIADPPSLDSANSAERAFGGGGAPSPMGGGCDPTLSPTNPPWCTAAAPTTLAGFPTDGSSYGILTNGQINTIGSQFNQSSVGSFDFTMQIPTQPHNTPPPPVRGAARDYTVIALAVDVPTGANCLSLDYRFLSEEFPGFVGQQFNDAFIAELDTTNWSVSASGDLTRPNDFAASPAGNAVSVNGAGPTAMFPAEAEGTYFNGATGLVTTKTPVTPGPHTIYLSMFDASDGFVDSAVFLDRLRFISESSSTCQPPLALDPPANNPGTPASPSNQFSLGSSVTLKTKNGSGTITFTVPGPGTMTLGDPGAGASSALARTSAKKKKAKKRPLVARTSATATAAGPLQVPFKLTKAGKKALKQKKGKGLRVRVKATFTPVGGSPATQQFTLTVK